MHKLLRIALLMTCVLATAGFGACGKAVRPDPPVACPVLPPAPANLMQAPNYVQPVQDELLEPLLPAKPR